MNARAGIAAVFVAAVLLSVGAVRAVDRDSTEADVLAQDMAAQPGVPYVLPRRLPEDVTWFGSGPFLRDGDGVAVRSVDFKSTAGVGTVTVCAARDTSAARSCPGPVADNVVISRTARGFTVRIGLSGATRGDADFWRDVGLSLDTQQPWLA